MDAIKRTILFLVAVGLLATGLSATLYRDHRKAADRVVLHVGAGNDITGLLMDDLVESTKNTSLQIELNTFMDCCGNAAQWAMTSDDLDAGFYCSSIALTLINRNSDLEIYGPAVINAEVVALGRDPEDVCTMAIPMKRSFLNEIVYANFPAVTEIFQVSTTSLNYAVSGGQVDGAIVDVAKALSAPDFDYVRLSDEDHISYSLVVNKNIVDTAQFAEFLDAYNQMADKYNRIEYLKSRYDMSDSFWQMIHFRFLYL